ncbi:metal-dependent phosphohydrolase, partial [Streptomyces fradiae]
MAGIPVAARVYLACAALGATACTLPALAPGSSPRPWGTAALLAGLYAFCTSPAGSRLTAVPARPAHPGSPVFPGSPVRPASRVSAAGAAAPGPPGAP